MTTNMNEGFPGHVEENEYKANLIKDVEKYKSLTDKDSEEGKELLESIESSLYSYTHDVEGLSYNDVIDAYKKVEGIILPYDYNRTKMNLYGYISSRFVDRKDTPLSDEEITELVDFIQKFGETKGEDFLKENGFDLAHGLASYLPETPALAAKFKELFSNPKIRDEWFEKTDEQKVYLRLKEKGLNVGDHELWKLLNDENVQKAIIEAAQKQQN